ncbi:MAG: Clp1/GlmU family protein [Candidatus Nezhaarchaeales archaeon]
MERLVKIENFLGYYIVEGPLKIRLIEGFMEVTGKRLDVNEEVVIPTAKATLIEAPRGAKIELRGSGTVNKLEASTVPREWLNLIDSLPKDSLVFALGCIDVGKTFFVTYTANKLLSKGFKVSVVDCDVGQSDIGPPTTIGLSILDKQVAFLESAPLTSAYFVGSTSPAGHLLPMITGTLKLVSHAKRVGGTILVDTPGMVHGGPARAYQLYAIESISPDVIVALQRNHELSHLTKQLKALGYDVLELPASPWVRQRDREDRRALRERAFYNYFAKRGLVDHTISLDKVAIVGSFMGSGCRAPPETIQVIESIAGCRVEYCEISQDAVVLVLEEKPRSKDFYASVRSAFSDKTVKFAVRGFERGLVVGLLGEKSSFLDIGILKSIDFKAMRVSISTPLRNVEQVRVIKLGCVRLEEYREVEKLEPGFI